MGEHRREKIKLTTCRLDDLISADSLSRPIFVKMYTQGAEARIVGGGPVFFEGVDAILFEFWPYGLVRHGEYMSVLSKYLSANYSKGVVLPPTSSSVNEHDFRSIDEVVSRMKIFAETLHPHRQVDVLAVR